MGKRDDLYQCRSGSDFVKYAYRHKAEVNGGHGGHIKVSTEKGTAIVPYHNHEMGTGLRQKLIKAFIALGLIFILYLFIISNLV